MDYWKNNQQTLSTEYQDISFTKHTPLKASKINSASILSQSNLNVHLRSSSMESIQSSKKYLPISNNSHSQKQFIRNRVSRSQMHTKNFSIDEETKRNAYLFFNQQKNKLLATKKICQYLLPKICVKSKKTYHSVNTQNAQHQDKSSIRNSNASSNLKVQRKSIFKERKLNISKLRKQLSAEELNGKKVTQKFKLKCQVELEKINFMIPDQFRRQKCFFDLNQKEINRFYAEPRSQKRPEYLKENDVISVQKKVKRKFNPIRIDSQESPLQQNKSIPLFLMQRLSVKNICRTTENSFITDVPKIKKKVTHNQKLRHIA